MTNLETIMATLDLENFKQWQLNYLKNMVRSLDKLLEVESIESYLLTIKNLELGKVKEIEELLDKRAYLGEDFTHAIIDNLIEFHKKLVVVYEYKRKLLEMKISSDALTTTSLFSLKQLEKLAEKIEETDQGIESNKNRIRKLDSHKDPEYTEYY